MNDNAKDPSTDKYETAISSLIKIIGQHMEVTKFMTKMLDSHTKQITRMKRFLISVVVVALAVIVGLGVTKIGHDYRVAIFSVIVGIVIAAVGRLIYKEWWS